MRTEHEFRTEALAIVERLRAFGSPADALIVLAYSLGLVTAMVERFKTADEAFAEFSRLCIGEFHMAFMTIRSSDDAALRYQDHARFFRCKGCGQPAMEFLTDCPPYYVKGAVGHTKPMALAGTRGLVPCAMYKKLSVSEYRELHKDAQSIDPPEKFEPMV